MQANFIRTIFTGLALCLIAAAGHAVTIDDKPAYLSTGVPPLVMLALTKDHQLFYKAYNDYTDLNNDGVIETSYTHTFDYYGYFDPYKCYKYDGALKYFYPFSVTTDKYCAIGDNQWSGNFLNWGSMTRMDVLRKLLYGGYRSSDPTSSSSATILERALLPTEAHSFAKYYNGSDINKLTPFTVPTSPPTGSSTTSTTIITPSTSSVISGTGTCPGCSISTKIYYTGVSIGVGDAIHFSHDSSNYMDGVVDKTGSDGVGNFFTFYVAKALGVSSSYSSWTITNYTQTGISLCNTTAAFGTTEHSQSTSYPPLIRVAKGNYALWASNEVWQCAWYTEKKTTDSNSSYLQSNGNDFTASSIVSSSENPSPTTQGLLAAGTPTPDYIARVKVCDSGTGIGLEANCKTYPSGNNKPIGLLQKYGDNGTIKFGLMTGTYSKNISGGALRKNVGDMTDEVNTTTNGVFKSAPGIVSTVNKMRLFGYQYAVGSYNTDDQCTNQQIGIVVSGGSVAGGAPAQEGNCSSWGNPMSEIFLETLRYFAGKAADSRFASGTKDATLGLSVGTWSDPLNASNYCSPLNVILINASSASYDDDQMDKITDIGASSSAAALTKTVGDGELITGGTYFIGDNGVATPDGLCSGKTVSDLGAIKGLCPDTPSLKGTYLMAGTAWYAHTNHIRSDSVATAVPATDKKSLTVTTYAVQLASNTPTIQIPVPGVVGQTVTLIPAYRLDLGSGKYGTGTLVDFKVVKPYTLVGGTATGTFYVNWEDSNQGGDYDQDMWGLITYSITSTNITVSTTVIARAGANPQGFGYIISGTGQDGAHFHSGAYGFNFTDSTGVTGCIACGGTIPSPVTSWTYTVASSGSAGSLHDPLWYAAKWGGFVESGSDNKPLILSEWDNKTATGATGSDGVPDTYFYVTNPAQLENAMQSALFAILAESSASAVATNSTSLKTDSLVFQARFNSKDWSGQLLAYKIDSTGAVATTFEWDAGAIINTQSDSDARHIITLNRDTGKGLPFEWVNISALTDTTQKDFLNNNAGGTPDGKGSDRLAYLRGSKTLGGKALEGISSDKFRTRPTSRLGDIAFSNPKYEGPPNDGYFGSSYATFRNSPKASGGYSDRTPVVYVGANDGMLHGFNACYPANTTTCLPASQGTELIAYVPGKAYSNLSQLTDQNYSHKFFVDGSPTVNDAYGVIGQCAAACWRTVLVSGMNAGGQGVFALDVTDPEQFADEANADKLLLWEFTNADDSDLGYTYSQPIVARLSNGRWVAIFGNGYNSASGTAALFVLYLDKPLGAPWVAGTNFFKIDTGCKISPCAPASGGNGLSGIAGWDLDGDGNINFVYGGDLQGNLWKFDLSGTPSLLPSTGWKVALGGAAPYTPIFTAVDLVAAPNRQPIATPPVISAHPLSGMLVLFGTGKILASTDISDKRLQTFYAIWDKNDGTTVPGRSSLLQQTITSEDSAAGNRATSANTMNWRTLTSVPPDYLGWYMDLVVAPPPTVSNMMGERHVGTPKLINGVVFFNTYVPSTALCDFGGDGWLMALNYATGGLLPYPPFDTNNDGVIASTDSPTGGKKVGAAFGGSTIITKDGSAGTSLSSQSKGDIKSTPVQTQGLRGRVTWRELIQN